MLPQFAATLQFYLLEVTFGPSWPKRVKLDLHFLYCCATTCVFYGQAMVSGQWSQISLMASSHFGACGEGRIVACI